MYKVIDIKNWERKSVYEFFNEFDDQLFSIDFDLNLPPDFVKNCKKKYLTPFIVCLYTMTKALNEIAEFRVRKVDGEIRQYEKINPVWVEVDKTKNLVPVTCEYKEGLDDFLLSIKERKNIEPTHFTQVPNHFTASNNHWLNWTSVKHTRHRNNETNQKLVWGQYEDGRVRFSMEVSHLFVDGYHISLFKKAVEDSLLVFFSMEDNK